MFLIGRCGEFARFVRVRDKGGFDQHRGDVWRTQHDEVGALHLPFVDFADAAQFVQGFLRKDVAGFNGRFLLHTEQCLLDVVIILADVHAPAQIHRVFGAFEVFTDGGGRALGGEDVHG